MSALWLQMRFSIARMGFIPLALLGIVILFGRNRFWIGIWPESGAAVQVSAVFLSIFAAGVAALIAARVESRGLHEQAAAAAIRPFVIELSRFTAALLWLASPYLIVVIAGFVATAVKLFPPGVGIYFEYVLIGAAMIVFGTAWGWLVGRLLTPLLAAVCAALSWFIGAAFLASTAGAAVMSGPPWMEVRFGAVGVRLAAVLLFAAVVCALPWRADWRGSFGRWVWVALLALVGTVTSFVNTSVVGHRAPVAKPLCIQGVMEYCLWPEHAKYVPMIQDLDRRLAALPVQLPAPERVVDYALSGSTEWIDEEIEVELPGAFPPEFDISTGSRWALARGIAAAILDSTFADCGHRTQPDPDHRWDQLHAWLEWRLAGGGTHDYSTNAPSDLQAAWSVGRQTAQRKSEQDQAGWVIKLIAEEKNRYCNAA
ncbi:hypothetical protein [Micromonospora sagamiensis]|uniref:ABC-type transport system involved in multi-copper enzyme maturation permease subunit n=1 Tax=Micromonospora sagamiensis TaxID=47875 RepID=A0A562WLX6_9ACTN|nr:hypothetical protein [Micromonospora sagamiensis]TWJ31182.1 hypothetical protein JD81_04736 [Micromonospora sagamiensis]BCL15773.1 hypothetical protein GCM10017556_35120 [Micromonospora sagamiensis]